MPAASKIPLCQVAPYPRVKISSDETYISHLTQHPAVIHRRAVVIIDSSCEPSTPLPIYTPWFCLTLSSETRTCQLTSPETEPRERETGLNWQVSWAATVIPINWFTANVNEKHPSLPWHHSRMNCYTPAAVLRILLPTHAPPLQ